MRVLLFFFNIEPVMGLRRLLSLKLAWVLTFFLCVLPSMVRTQIQGCSIQGIDLEQCLINQGNYSIDACCNALNQALQAGIYCLCSLLLSSSTTPLLSTPFAFPFSNCYISIPPLSLCRVQYPVPVLPPPMAPAQSSGPQNVLVPAPPQAVPVPVPVTETEPEPVGVLMNATQDVNSTIVAKQPDSSENAEPKFSLFNTRKKTSFAGERTKNSSCRTLLLSMALCACII